MWTEALSACTNIWPGANGNLASFHSIEEYNFIVKLWREASSLDRCQVGGLRSAYNNTLWTWTDGTPLNMTLINSLWKKRQPDNYNNNESIMEIWVGLLNDAPACNKRGTFVCKIPCASCTSPELQDLGCERSKAYNTEMSSCKYSLVQNFKL